MSIRRKVGDVLIKRAGAGFTGQELKVKIPSLEEFQAAGFDYTEETIKEEYDMCLMGCSDPECREFANLLVLDESGQVDLKEWVFHVSECQLEDLKK